MKFDFIKTEPKYLFNPLNWSLRRRVVIGLTLFLVFMLIVFFPAGQRFIALLLITIFSFGTVFFKASRQIPIDFTPTLLLLLFVHNAFGTGYSFFFIIFGYILPGVLGWGAPDAFAIIYWVLLYGLTLLSPVFFGLGFVWMGVTISAIEFVASSILNVVVGKSFAEFIPFTAFAFFINIAYFLLIGPFVAGFM